MGDFPMMTDRGTFIINGTERIVVSQLVRSPGVYFGLNPDKTAPEKDIADAKMIPGRGAWLEFEVDKKDVVYVRIDRKRKQPVTVLLKALGFGETDEELLNLITDEDGRPYESMRNTLEKDHTASVDEAFIDIYRKLRPGEPPTPDSARAAARRTCSSTRSATTSRRSAATRSRRSSARSTRSSASSASTSRRPPATSTAARRLHADQGRHPRCDLVPREAAQPNEPGLLPRRHRPLRQPPGALGRRAHPEPGPRRPLAHGARRARAHDDPGRRGDHAADAHQHPSGGRGDQGVLRLVAAVAVHGPDEPARGSHPQAPPLGARPGRSVA